MYWRRLEKRRNAHHVRQSLILTVHKELKIDDLYKVAETLSGVIDGKSFDQKFHAHIESFTYPHNTQLIEKYAQLQHDYGLKLGKEALKEALTHQRIGDVSGLGVEIRETSVNK